MNLMQKIFPFLAGVILLLSFYLGWQKLVPSQASLSLPKELKKLSDLPKHEVINSWKDDRSFPKGHVTPESLQENERTVSLQFQDQESYNRFLQSSYAQEGTIHSYSSRLKALRLSTTQWSRLEEEFDSQFSLLPPALFTEPDPPLESNGISLEPIGNRLFELIRIPTDNQNAGQGYKIAVIDSGLLPHPGIVKGINEINLSGTEERSAHGTGVTSILNGRGENLRGIVPQAEILSIKVTDENGVTDQVTLAEAIVLAVEQGSHLINLSLGSDGSSPLIKEAIDFAVAKGVILVAASGNDGTSSSLYPARDPRVISVGALDASFRHAFYSNRDDELSFSAPSHGIFVAGEEESLQQVSGTSFSAPIISGAIIATADHFNIPVSEAASLLERTSNDAGLANQDPLFGEGYPDLERTFFSRSPNRYDLSTTSIIVDDKGGASVVIENQGTEIVEEASLFIKTGEGPPERVALPAIAPGQSLTVPSSTQVSLDPSTSVEITAGVILPAQITDLNLQDNAFRISRAPLESLVE